MIPDSAIGPILAALIAALISLLGLIISKESKVSDFRQEWIDALRQELSDYIAHIHNLSGLAGLKIESDMQFWKLSQADMLGVNKVSTSIRRRLNPNEKYSKTVFSILDEFEQSVPDGKITDFDEIQRLERLLVDVSQKLLKSEWKRVKNGEIVYQVARATSFAFVLSAVVAALIWFNSNGAF